MSCHHDWHGHPVPTCSKCGREPHASPSQLEQRRLCRRRWKYSRTRPREPNAAADSGIVSHGILERWQRFGEWPAEDTPERACVAAGLHHFPPPFKANAVELEAQPVIFGVRWWMKLDCIANYVPDRYLLVSDLKTTGDLRWAKTPEQLRSDPQWIAYGGWAALTWGVEWIAGQWVYCKRPTERNKRTGCRPVQIIERGADVIGRLGMLTVTEVMPMIADNALPLEAFPRDGIENGACDVYGRAGCPYKAECLADIPPEQIVAIRLARSEARVLG